MARRKKPWSERSKRLTDRPLNEADALFDEIMDRRRFEDDWDSEFHLCPAEPMWALRDEMVKLGAVAMPTLRDAACGRDHRARQEALSVLWSFGPPAGEEGAGIIEEAIGRCAPDDVRRAVSALMQVSPSTALEKGYDVRGTSESRQVVMDSLAYHETPEGIGRVVNLLKHPDVGVRRDAATVLGKHEEALRLDPAPVVRALTDEDRDVRVEALRLLCKKPPEPWVQAALIDAVLVDLDLMCGLVVDAVASHPRSVDLLEAVARRLQESKQRVEAEQWDLEHIAKIACAARELGCPVAVPDLLIDALLTLLEDSIEYEGLTYSCLHFGLAARAAGQLGDLRLLPAVLSVLVRADFGSARVEAGLFAALRAFGETARVALRELLQSQDEPEIVTKRAAYLLEILERADG